MEITYSVGDIFKCNRGYGVCITDTMFIILEERPSGRKFATRLAQIPEDSVPLHENERVSCEKETLFTLKCIRMTALACAGSINNYNAVMM